MLSKSIEKYVNSLKQKKHRITEGCFVAEGEKLAEELLVSDFRADKIIATTDWIREHERLLRNSSATLIEISEAEMKRVSGLMQPSSVLLVMEMMASTIDEAIVQSSLNLVLDDIRDPGNMGTIVRIADWFGIPYIFCSEECVDVYNQKVIQASMGSLVRVKVIETKLTALFEKFPSLPVYAAQLTGENIFSASLKQEAFIIIGNEARGISASLTPFISKQLTIPRTGKAESLNAAVAAGIVCAMFRSKTP